MAHVAPWKKEEVARLSKLLQDSPVVAVAQIGGIPGPQMQEMRASLRGGVTMVGVKNRLLKLAIEDAAKNRPKVAELAPRVDGQTALLATDQNPFRLYKSLRAGATMAPLKPNQISPVDVEVKKGPTPFGPGPIVGELQKVGIPAKIEGPKVVVLKDVTPVKAGDTVAPDLAGMLAKLEVKPVELAIEMEAAVDADTLFTPDVLAVDEEKVMGDVVRAALAARSVALEASWPTSTTIAEMIGRAYRAGRGLALDATWVTADTAEEILGKAFKIAVAVGIESGAELGDSQDLAAKAYAAVLAATGKTEADLSDEVKERLGEHIAVLGAKPAAAPTEESSEPEEEEEEASEEDAAAGLGSLFG